MTNKPYVWIRNVLSAEEQRELHRLVRECPDSQSTDVSTQLSYPDKAGRVVCYALEVTRETIKGKLDAIRARFPDSFDGWSRSVSYEASGNRCLRDGVYANHTHIPYRVHSDGEVEHLVVILYAGQWSGGRTKIASDEEYEAFKRQAGCMKESVGDIIAPESFELRDHEVAVEHNSILVFHQERAHCITPVESGVRVSIHMRLTSQPIGRTERIYEGPAQERIDREHEAWFRRMGEYFAANEAREGRRDPRDAAS